MEQVPRKKATTVCKFGQGELTCAYLIAGSVFECAKDTSQEIAIEERLKAGTNVAKGYNCSKGRGSCVMVCVNKDVSCDTCHDHSNIVCNSDKLTEGVPLCGDRCSRERGPCPAGQYASILAFFNAITRPSGATAKK